MVHQRQGLALGLEPGDDLLGIHARLDDLERHPAADGLLLLGHVDDAHAPFADLLEQLVRADPMPGPSSTEGRLRPPDGLAATRLARRRKGVRRAMNPASGSTRGDSVRAGQGGPGSAGGSDDRPIEEVVRLIMGPQERFDSSTQLPVVRAFPIQEGGASGGVPLFNRRQEDCLNASRIDRHGILHSIGGTIPCVVQGRGCRKNPRNFQPPRASRSQARA